SQIMALCISNALKLSVRPSLLALCQQQSARCLSNKQDELILDFNRCPGVCVALLNRPQAKNALSKSLIGALESAFAAVRSQRALRALVFGSAVPGVFCAGADLKERATMPESDVGPFVAKARDLLQELAELPLPTVAAIDGAALGGGLELALACDLRVASDDARLGLVETRLAIIPGAGGTQRLPRVLGPSLAKELIYTARVLTGAEAQTLGLVSRSVPQQQGANGFAALASAIELASEIAKNGPVALSMAKKAIDNGMSAGSMRAALDVEANCYARVIPTKDRLEGLRAFKEKRTPVYTGE
ncbi:hypothetical protein BOX15_Mlig026764g1, partial [Macrostomum lignano]